MRRTLTARPETGCTPPKGEDYEFDAGLYNGRFQIVTEAHRQIALSMRRRARLRIVNTGSINQSRDLRNAFTYGERLAMWHGALTEEEREGFVFIGQEDRGNGKIWASEVQSKVDDVLEANGIVPIGLMHPRVMVIGHRKDASSSYLDDFPTYDLVEERNIGDNLSASAIRDEMFALSGTSHAEAWFETLKGRVPDGVLPVLRRFMDDRAYSDLAEEARLAAVRERDWAVRTAPDGPGVPHSVIFNVSMAFVTQGNSVLLQRRRSYPGKNLWTLPGGFIGQHERVMDAALRHTVASTRIDVSETVLRNALVDDFYEDDPWRSSWGRTIAFVHAFELKPVAVGRTSDERRRSVALPSLRGGERDDLGWFTFDQVAQMRDQLFEDGAIVIEKALQRLTGIKRGR